MNLIDYVRQAIAENHKRTGKPAIVLDKALVTLLWEEMQEPWDQEQPRFDEEILGTHLGANVSIVHKS